MMIEYEIFYLVQMSELKVQLRLEFEDALAPECGH